MMKRFLIVLILFAIIAGVAAFLLNPWLNAASKRLFNQIEFQEVLPGILVEDVSFDRVRFKWPIRIEVSDINVSLKVMIYGVFLDRREMSIKVHRATVDFSRIFQMTAFVKFDDLRIFFNSSSVHRGKANPESYETRVIGQLVYPVSWGNWIHGGVKEGVRKIAGEFSEMLKEGRSDVEINFEGQAVFPIRGAQFVMPIRTVKIKDQRILVMNREDVRRLAALMEEKLSDSEIEIVSQYPLRAVRLLKIKNHAESEAKIIHQNYPEVPEDAYRHILWSYLLTSDFGPDFAKRVTDAHEEGEKEETDADHLMDTRNNELGRRYAMEGYEERQLIRFVMNDSRVVMDRSEIA